MTALDFSTSTHTLKGALKKAWAPRPRLTITEVAERYRILSSEDSHEPGPYRVARTPYVQEPQDRLSPQDPVQVVVLAWAAQTAKTSVGLNWALAVMGYYPAPMLGVFPKEDNARDWSRQRMDPMISSSTLLRDRVTTAKARTKEATVMARSFPGGRLRLAGSNSPNDLAAMPARYALIEEADRHPRDVGGEGSSTSLVIARQTTFGASRKTLIVSTPTVAGESEVWEWYLRGDQRFLWVPCPSCGEYQRLQWKDPDTGTYRLVWPSGHPEEARYTCAHCGHSIEDRDKNVMLPAGEWRAARPDLGEGGTITSYHLNGLYSPHGWLSWAEMAREWEQATTRAKAGDVERLRTYVNTRLAQTFEAPSDTVEPGSLQARVEPDWDAVPLGVQAVVCGTDVQDDRTETLTLGIGAGQELWVLSYNVIHSDPLDQQTWTQHDAILQRRWTREDGEELRVLCSCVDSGFRTQAVYDYCRTRKRRRWNVHAVKGRGGKSVPIWESKVRKGGKNKNLGRFHLVGTDTAKDTIYAILQTKTPGPRYLHVPESILRQYPDWFTQLTNEKRVKKTDKSGRSTWVWVPKVSGARQEVLDTMVYCLAALAQIRGAGVILDPTPASPSQQKKPRHTPPVAPSVAATPPAKPTPPKRRSSPRPKRGSGDWFDPSKGRGGSWF